MPNEIDEVMRRCCEDPTLLAPEDYDVLIAYQRKQKANYDAGIKPTKKSAKAALSLDETPALTLASIGLSKTPKITNKFRRPGAPSE